MKKVVLLFSLLFSFAWGQTQANGFEVTKTEFIGLSENSYVESISPSGQYVIGGLGTGFIWNINNPSFDLIFSPGLEEEKSYTTAYAANDNRQVAGVFRHPEMTIMYPDFTLDPEGNILVPTPITVAGIWENGEIINLGIGTLKLEDLPTPEHGSQALALSDDGKIAAGCILGQKAPDMWGTRVDSLLPCKWILNESTEKWDYVEYDFPKPSQQGAKITHLSGDGSIAAGWVEDIWGSRLPIVWKSPTEYLIIGQGDFDNISGSISDISANGKYVTLTLNYQGVIYDVENNTYEIIETHPGAAEVAITGVTDEGFVVGYSQFGNQIFGFWRIAFVYSKDLGFMDFQDFINTYAPDVEIPSNFSFDPNRRELVVPMDISKDGKVITGWSGPSSLLRWPWVLTMDKPIVVYKKPTNLQLQLTGRNNVTLVWDAPAVDPEHELKGYKVYRNSQQIETLAKETQTYSETAPGGIISYQVSAIYDGGDSPLSEVVTATIVDNYDIPFFEEFETADFNTNYWTPSSATSKWSISPFMGKGIYGAAASFSDWTDSYDDGMVSKPLDATNLENIYLTFALRSGYPMGSSYQYSDVLNIDVLVDNTWKTVKQYPGDRKESEYNIELIELTESVKGKLFQLRFRVQGSGDSRSWDIDNVRVDFEKNYGNNPDNILGELKDDGSANLIWTNPTGAYELSYEQTPLMDQANGNAGVPFIAAIKYNAADLSLYHGLYFTSVTAYINKNIDEEELEIGLFIQNGDNKITQDIPYFIPNSWNTFLLDSPILIDGTKDLIFGINVIKHDISELPIACDSSPEVNPAVDGKGNLFSENGGTTWKKLSDYTLPYIGVPMPYNWSIVGNLTESATPSEIPVKDENIAGYSVYRNGVRITDALLYLPQFTDESASGNDAYVVNAYYLDNGTLSPESQEYSLIPNKICNRVVEDNIVIYPIPATESIYINGEYSKATLTNVNGQIISTTLANEPINVSTLSDGIYFLEITTQEGTITKKIVVRK